MEFVFWLCGFIVGAVIWRTWFQRPVGTLKIDYSDPKKDIYRLELDDLSVLDSKKRITLKIDVIEDLSQK